MCIRDRNLNENCSYCSVSVKKLEKKPTPIVDLPLGSTEDRVVGSLNLEVALSQGKKSFEPGLLAHANRGYLYIDEVNLLEDHIVHKLIILGYTFECFLRPSRRQRQL